LHFLYFLNKKNNYYFNKNVLKKSNNIKWGLGIGDWGLGIED